MGEHIKFVELKDNGAEDCCCHKTERGMKLTRGSAGLASQLPGCAATVGNLASATGGIKPGNLVSTDN